MPIPLVLAGIAAAQAAPKIAAAISQKRKANRLKLQDNVPQAFKEQLAGLRLGAATARMPGMGAAEGKLAQNFAAGAAAAARGGGSSADVLAGINALSLQRQQGQNALNVQGQQYQDVAKQRLNAGLGQLGAYQSQAQRDYDNAKSSLVNSSNQNLNNAVDGIANFAAFGLQGMGGGATAAAPDLSSLSLGGLGGVPVSGVGLSNYGMTRRKQRGIGVY